VPPRTRRQLAARAEGRWQLIMPRATCALDFGFLGSGVWV